MTYGRHVRSAERGNVLFLILIAVALFATLSYAVIQSTRSGGVGTSKETSTVDVAQILTVSNSYRTTVQRMMVGQGMDGGDIVAVSPSAFGVVSAQLNTQNLYHPTGGAMPYPIPPKNLMDPVYDTNVWSVNSENEVKNVGATTAIPDIDHVELIAFLPGLKKSVCEAINEKLGITGGMPVSYADVTMNASSDPPTYMENGGAGVIGGTASDSQLTGKLEGCFQVNGTSDWYAFYAVLVGR